MDFVANSYRQIISILTNTLSQMCEKLKKEGIWPCYSVDLTLHRE